MHGGPLGGGLDKRCWDCKAGAGFGEGSWSASARRHRGCPRCPETGTLTQLLGTLVVNVLHDQHFISALHKAHPPQSLGLLLMAPLPLFPCPPFFSLCRSLCLPVFLLVHYACLCSGAHIYLALDYFPHWAVALITSARPRFVSRHLINEKKSRCIYAY